MLMDSDEEIYMPESNKANEPDFNISMGIIKSITTLFKNQDFKDFEVTIDGDIYPCHSHILASCSKFFNGLLRSNMKEKREMKVQLTNISSSIFELILKTLYTGMDLLTTTNVLEVWSAVHQLQIQFLIQHCEDFVMNNLSIDNLEIYKEHAEYLHSEKVCDYIFDFFLLNFDTLRDKEVFLRLDFHYLTKLLKCDDLQVRSENDVLSSVFDWVNYSNILTQKSILKCVCTNRPPDVFPKGDSLGKGATQENNPMNKKAELGDRKQYFIPLIKATRYFLANEDLIVKLYNDQLIQSDVLVKEILQEALAFQYRNFLHDFWPTTATHRNCSHLQHCGIVCTARNMEGYSFRKRRWFQTQILPRTLDSKLMFFKGKLYACSIGSVPTEICYLQRNVWELVTTFSHPVHMFMALENYIYLLDDNAKEMTRFNPDISPLKLETFTYKFGKPDYALCVWGNIVVFCCVYNNTGEAETAVHSWSTKTQKWTRLENLNFTSEYMTSFRDDVNTYILDGDGNLWRLTSTEVIGFTFLAKLWRENCYMKGAVLFRETLHIFYNDYSYMRVEDIPIMGKIDGVFSSALFKAAPGNSSNVVHYVIDKKELRRF